VDVKESAALAKLEAALYASGRPLSFKELSARLGLGSEEEASRLARRLSEMYRRDGSALEVRELPGGLVVMQLKADYVGLARRVSSRPVLTSGPLRTLSYVAYYQPVEQRRVALARGSNAYRHLKLLEEMGLIKRQRRGRNIIVETTPEFASYLGLSSDRSTMKRQLSRIFKELELKALEREGDQG
jgi:segregation and condensation protein B